MHGYQKQYFLVILGMLKCLWSNGREGYSLLLHGLGSKRNLINDFHCDVLSDHPTLVINGFFPSLMIKDVSQIYTIWIAYIDEVLIAL